MDPLELIDKVVAEYWKDRIWDYLYDSPYDCFCESTGEGPQHLVSRKEILEKLPLPSEEGGRPVGEFFDLDELFNSDLKLYTEQDLIEDIQFTYPIFNAVESLAGKAKNTEWKEVVCNLSFFDADTVRETNDFAHEFQYGFGDFASRVADKLKFPPQPLVKYTDNPAKKIWEKTTVDGVPLFEFLGI